MRHGRHWPREEQNANAFEGFGGLFGDESAAARVRAAWAATIPPYITEDTVFRPEFDNVGRYTDG